MLHVCLRECVFSIIPHFINWDRHFWYFSECLRVCVYVYVFSFASHTKCLIYVYPIMREHVLQHAIKSEHVDINLTHKHRKSHISHIASVIIAVQCAVSVASMRSFKWKFVFHCTNMRSLQYLCIHFVRILQIFTWSISSILLPANNCYDDRNVSTHMDNGTHIFTK